MGYDKPLRKESQWKKSRDSLMGIHWDKAYMERRRGPIWDGQKKSREDVLNNDGHMHGMELCEPIIIITKAEMVHVFVCV